MKGHGKAGLEVKVTRAGRGRRLEAALIVLNVELSMSVRRQRRTGIETENDLQGNAELNHRGAK
jgi:hypothetical protein